MPDNRLAPEKFLQRAQAEEQKKSRGKFKIYLGAAPGVGKTHEMLHDALEERSKGLDVVIGVVESHGREEIKAMLKDFEILPREVINYHGKELLEFDLDAAIRRHPALILMDEMAHANAPSTRHKKRWQDIKELLDLGIDVYTTLNVQHIESLNDNVSQIIHAPIKETVPDSMIEMADTLELIDIPPEELLTRLRDGKVYIPEQAKLAADHFFKIGNLIALRELALRIMAERVGAQVILYRQGQNIKHVWPTKEKILVCVGPDDESKKLLRAARRLATSLQIEWIAVFVDTPKIQNSPAKKNKAIQNLHFAEKLGAMTRMLTGFDIVQEIMAFARDQNVTQIMVYKIIRPRIRSLFFRNLADELVRVSGEIDVYIMTGRKNNLTQFQQSKNVTVFKPWKSHVLGFMIVGVATATNFLLSPFLSASNLIMVYLLGITIVALLGEIGPALSASIVSVLAYDFFFIPPYFSFAVSDIQYFFTLVVMLIVSFIISHLASRIRKQSDLARFDENQIAVLHMLSRQLASTRGIDNILELGSQYIEDTFDCDVYALLPKGNQLVIRTKKNIPQLSKKELGIAKWVYDLKTKAGYGTDTLAFSNAMYVPLIGTQQTIGVLRILPKIKRLLTPEEMYLLEACSNQIALAVEVDKIQEKNKHKELTTQKHRVQNEILQTVSHDLHAPLVAVLDDVNALMERAIELNPIEIQKIGKKVYDELEQHSRLINNLLQITQFETESIQLNKQILSIKELINMVIDKSQHKLNKRNVRIHIEENIPSIEADSFLIQEVLLNLIDNAVKFSAPNTPIDINVIKQNHNIVISVEDEGPGIFHDEMNKLFEKYYRGREITTERGLGLGLAICSEIVSAHHGEIWVENKKEKGAAFRFSLPRDPG